MTGTGTNTDPYVITTVDELYSMSEVGGENVHFKLGNDIDFNNTEYVDNFELVPINCASLDGDGHSIRNIASINLTGIAYVFTVTQTAVSIRNLSFENIRASGKNVCFFYADSSVDRTVTFNRCTFRMKASISQTNPYSGGIRRCIMHEHKLSFECTLCSFYPEIGFYSVQAWLADSKLTRCQFNFKTTYYYNSGSTDDMYALFASCQITDSYFFGTMSSSANSLTANLCGSGCVLDTCYSAIDIGQKVSALTWKGTFNTVCFYDSDRMGSASINTNNTAKLLGLTTEQCKNAEYLRSVGFSCEEGD